jgi:hypothetical protein
MKYALQVHISTLLQEAIAYQAWRDFEGSG